MVDKYVVDTNTLLDAPQTLGQYTCIILRCVGKELENIKINGKEDAKYGVREAYRAIRKHKVKYDVKKYEYTLDDNYDRSFMDDKILQACVSGGYGLITSDVGLTEMAEGYGVEVLSPKEQDLYTGYKEVIMSDQAMAFMYEDMTINTYGLIPNQYLVVKDKEKQFVEAFRWTGDKLTPLKLPPSKVIKPLNELQRCALDMLNNKDIPIKVIAGHYGSGKTIMNIRMALYHTNEKSTYNKIMAVRSPEGPGKDVGYLPGSKWEKINDFFKPIYQQLENEDIINGMIQRGQIEFEIPYYMKGMSLNDYWVLVDEAEDLDLQTFKLIGSRVGQDACVVFSGDVQQAESRYRRNNGLRDFINNAKGNPLVGIVVLKDDVRSSASKVFADLV